MRAFTIVLLLLATHLSSGYYTQHPTVHNKGSWDSFQRKDDVAFFFYSSPPHLERYNTTNQTWFDSFYFSNATYIFGNPKAFHVSQDDMMYVSYDAIVLKYNLEQGSFDTILDIPAGGTVDTIFTDDDLLLLLGKGINGMDANLTIVDSNSFQVINFTSNLQWYARHLYGASISKQNNRIYGKTSGISSSDIAFWTYSDDGTSLSYEESTYYQDFSDAEKVWVFPANRRVVDEAGIVFDAITLSYLNSFALPDFIIDIDWIDGLPIAVHSEHKFTLFNNTTLLPILVAESDVVNGAVLNIMANDVMSTVSIFRSNGNSYSTNGIDVEVISIADFVSPEPTVRDLDPANLIWSPDDSFVGPNDVLHFLSKDHEAIFRWDPNSYNYGSTIHLFGSPKYISYSLQTGTIYTVYEETRLIMRIKDNLEEPFATLPASPIGIVTAGQYLFAATSENLFTVFYTFDSDGILISSERGESSLDYVWNNATQRVYYFRNDFDPGDMSWVEIKSNGELGEKMKSGLQDSRYMHPILIHPQANYVLLGSGQFYDPDTFDRLNFTLPSKFDEGITSENGLLILRSTEEGFGSLEKWSNNFALLMTTRIDKNYNVKALLQTSNGRYVIALGSAVKGSPLFLVFEESLQTIYEPETRFSQSPSATPGSPTNLDSNYTLHPYSGPPSYKITSALSKQPSNTFVPSGTSSPIVSSGSPTNLDSNYTLHPYSGPPSYKITSPPIHNQPSDCTGNEVLLNIALTKNFEAEWILYDDCGDFTFIANKTSSIICVPRSRYLFMIEALSGPGNFTLFYDNKFIHLNETIDVGKRFLFGEENCRNHTDNISPSSAPSANFRCAPDETNMNITIGNVSLGGNDDDKDEMKWKITTGCSLSYARFESGSGSMSACIPRGLYILDIFSNDYFGKNYSLWYDGMLVHDGYDYGYRETVQFGDGICSTFVNVISSSNGIFLYWDAVGEADKYSIYRREDWQDWKEDWVLVGNTTANVTSFTDNSQLNAWVTYDYQVYVHKGNEISLPSNIVNVRLSAPRSPDFIRGVATAHNETYIYWGYVENAAEYRLRIFMKNNFTIIKTNDTAYIHQDLPGNTTIEYKVLALNEFGRSNFTESLSVTTWPEVPPLHRSPILTKTAATPTLPEVILWWNHLENADYYELERSFNPFGGWENVLDNMYYIWVSNIYDTHFHDIGLDYDTTYYYRVRGVNEVSKSEWSNILHATTVDMILQDPLMLEASFIPEYEAVRLYWDGTYKVDDARRIIVERRNIHESNKWTWLSDLSPIYSSFVDTNVEKGGEYEYRIIFRSDSEDLIVSTSAFLQIGDPYYPNYDDDYPPSPCDKLDLGSPCNQYGNYSSVFWATEHYLLKAQRFEFQEEGQSPVTMANALNYMIGGDPGDAEYQTIEIEWNENSENHTERRFYGYFNSSASKSSSHSWQMFEARTYDRTSEWIEFVDHEISGVIDTCYEVEKLTIANDFGDTFTFEGLSMVPFLSEWKNISCALACVDAVKVEGLEIHYSKLTEILLQTFDLRKEQIIHSIDDAYDGMFSYIIIMGIEETMKTFIYCYSMIIEDDLEIEGAWNITFSDEECIDFINSTLAVYLNKDRDHELNSTGHAHQLASELVKLVEQQYHSGVERLTTSIATTVLCLLVLYLAV